MSKKEANARVLELMEHFGTKDNSVLSVEYFFYADKEDNACNLAIELHKLGYEIYNVSEPDAQFKQWSIIGCTSKINMDDNSVTEWTDKMESLAEENNCRFDGWGTLIDPDKD